MANLYANHKIKLPQTKSIKNESFADFRERAFPELSKLIQAPD